MSAVPCAQRVAQGQIQLTELSTDDSTADDENKGSSPCSFDTQDTQTNPHELAAPTSLSNPVEPMLPLNGHHTCAAQASGRDHFVEEHMHRQVRWSRAAFDDLQLRGEKRGSFSTPNMAMMGMLYAPCDASTDTSGQLHMQDNDNEGGLMQEHCHTHMRWSRDTGDVPSNNSNNSNQDKHTASFPFELQMNGVMHSSNGVQEDMQTHVQLEEDDDQEMRLQVDWHRQTRWSKDDQTIALTNGVKPDSEEADSQHYVEEHFHRQLRWSTAGRDGRRLNGDSHESRVIAAAPMKNGCNGGVELCQPLTLESLRTNGQHRSLPLNGYSNGNGFHHNGKTPPANGAKTLEHGLIFDGAHHLNGARINGSPAMQWSPQAYEQLLANGHGQPFKGLKMQGIMHHSNGVCNDLRLQVEGMRALQDRLTQMQESGRHQGAEVRRTPYTNGQIEDKPSQEDIIPKDDTDDKPAVGVRPAIGIALSVQPASQKPASKLNGCHTTAPRRVNGFKGHHDSVTKLNGHHHVESPHLDLQTLIAAANAELDLASYPKGHHDSVAKLNGHHHVESTHLDLQTLIAAANSELDLAACPKEPNRPSLSWPPKLNGHVASLPADLKMQGILHPRQSQSLRDDTLGQESDEDELRLEDKLQDPRIDILASLSRESLNGAVHAPCHIKGSGPRPETQPWWSAKAFDGLPLGDSVTASLAITTPKAAAHQGAPERPVADDDDMAQQLALSQSIIEELMRENTGMRQQIEESELKEERWRTEKQRLQKEIVFQRTSITTLSDANAHLQHQVDELRCLGDQLLSQIKSKMKNGLVPRQMGSS